MRLYSNIFFLLCIISVPAHAWAEMITGTVGGIDRDQKSFILLMDGERTLRVKRMHHPLPGRMKPGKQIRIWGRYDPATNVFRATDIRGVGGRHHRDQTGVRDRIGNGKYCRRNQDESGKPRKGRHPGSLPAAEINRDQP